MIRKEDSNLKISEVGVINVKLEVKIYERERERGLFTQAIYRMYRAQT